MNALTGTIFHIEHYANNSRTAFVFIAEATLCKVLNTPVCSYFPRLMGCLNTAAWDQDCILKTIDFKLEYVLLTAVSLLITFDIVIKSCQNNQGVNGHTAHTCLRPCSLGALILICILGYMCYCHWPWIHVRLLLACQVTFECFSFTPVSKTELKRFNFKLSLGSAWLPGWSTKRVIDTSPNLSHMGINQQWMKSAQKIDGVIFISLPGLSWESWTAL